MKEGKTYDLIISVYTESTRAIKLAIKEQNFFLVGAEGDRVAVMAGIIQRIHQRIDKESEQFEMSGFARHDSEIKFLICIGRS